MNTESGDKPHVKLESSCTLREVADLQFTLLSADPSANPLLLDGAAVERIDTCGLQLLAAFVKSREAAGRRVRWVGISHELQRCSDRLGLNGLLKFDGAIATGERS